MLCDRGRITNSLDDSPVALVEGWDVGECLVAGWVVVRVGGARIGHRGTLLVLVALLSSSLLCFSKLGLLPVYKQRLMMEGFLVGYRSTGMLVWVVCVCVPY
jgi:hypothetical protein